MRYTEYLSLNVNEAHIVKADQVFVESGILWLTQTGNLRDVLLFADQSYRSRRSGKIVIQALGENTKVILQSTPPGFRARKLISALINAVKSNFRFGLGHCYGRAGRTTL